MTALNMATHQSCSSIQSYLKSLLSLSLFIQIAISFVINPRNTSPLAGRPSHDGDDSYCADSPQWEYIGDQESDCLRAIRKLHDTEVSKHKDSEFEFLADNVQPHLSLAINRTPRKYMYSKFNSLRLGPLNGRANHYIKTLAQSLL